jgi:hypothetical protein
MGPRTGGLDQGNKWGDRSGARLPLSFANHPQTLGKILKQSHVLLDRLPACRWLDACVHLATPWYGSGSFWTVAGPVALLILGTLTLWVTYAVGNAGRRLIYSLPTEAPLIVAVRGVRSEVEIRHGGRVLVHPHLLVIRLQAKGRKDIRSSDFDQGKPLRLDVKVPVVALLKVNMKPRNVTPPDVRVTATGLEIDPVLIRKRQTMSFNVLVEGQGAYLTCDSPLGDVKMSFVYYPDVARKDLTETTWGALLILSPLLPLGAIIGGYVANVRLVIVAGGVSLIVLVLGFYALLILGLALSTNAQRKMDRERFRSE